MSAPDIGPEEVDAVVEVLRSGRLALGPRAEEFERSLSCYVGAANGVAVSSGTAALHLALRGLGIAEGDEVLVPSFAFAAAVNVVFYERAVPVFVDIRPGDLALDPEDLERKVTPRARAVLAVDVFGHPADWDALETVARRRGLRVVDDACEALGAEYRGRRLGTRGAATAFAFYPNKQITTGEGGMLVTDDDDLAAIVRSLRNQGRSTAGAWLEHERLGYNYRMDEMSAALGCVQLARIEQLLARRAAVARAYGEALRGLDGLRLPAEGPGVTVSWFVFVVMLAPGLDRDRFMRELARRGVPSRAYFPPLHLEPYVRERLPVPPPALPVTEAIAGRTVALPFHGSMTGAEVERVARACREALG